LNFDDIIQEKIKTIEQNTKNKVKYIEVTSSNFGAFVDFVNWTDRKELPSIKYKKNTEKIHFLHELLHLQSFFVDEFYIIAQSDPNLNSITSWFKQIPEDYIVHKTIYNKYKLNPIDSHFNERVFINEKMMLNNRDFASKLTLLYTYSEFNNKIGSYYKEIVSKIKKNNPDVTNMMDAAIDSLNKSDINNRASMKTCVQDLINIYAHSYSKQGQIVAKYFKKINSEWVFID